jgi:hypothetical protein
MGLLAATNGVGDMVSSALVGSLWAVAPDPAWGFGAAAALQALGAVIIALTARSLDDTPSESGRSRSSRRGGASPPACSTPRSPSPRRA